VQLCTEKEGASYIKWISTFKAGVGAVKREGERRNFGANKIYR
jgi:hypothetical protein